MEWGAGCQEGEARSTDSAKSNGFAHCIGSSRPTCWWRVKIILMCSIRYAPLCVSLLVQSTSCCPPESLKEIGIRDSIDIALMGRRVGM